MVPPTSKFYKAKFVLVFVLTLENAFPKRFHFKVNRKSIRSSKKRHQGLSKYPPFERSVCFYVTISKNFKRFQWFNFETDSLENENLFSIFQLKALRFKTHHFHTKLPYQNPTLRQIKWRLQNGPITKNEVLLVTAFFG